MTEGIFAVATLGCQPVGQRQGTLLLMSRTIIQLYEGLLDVYIMLEADELPACDFNQGGGPPGGVLRPNEASALGYLHACRLH